MSNLLDELYQKNTQTRIATGGARGIDPTIVENARATELAGQNQKAAVEASQAENMRSNRVEEGLQKDYIKDSKTAQNLQAVAMLGTTYLGSREGAKPAVATPTPQEQPLQLKPVYLLDNLFDVKLYNTDPATGKWQWNTQLVNNIWR